MPNPDAPQSGPPPGKVICDGCGIEMDMSVGMVHETWNADHEPEYCGRFVEVPSQPVDEFEELAKDGYGSRQVEQEEMKRIRVDFNNRYFDRYQKPKIMLQDMAEMFGEIDRLTTERDGWQDAHKDAAERLLSQGNKLHKACKSRDRYAERIKELEKELEDQK